MKIRNVILLVCCLSIIFTELTEAVETAGSLAGIHQIETVKRKTKRHRLITEGKKLLEVVALQK